MTWRTTTIPLNDLLSATGVMEAFKREFRDLKGFEVHQDPASASMRINYEVKDHGIWEWNEEVIEDGSGTGD